MKKRSLFGFLSKSEPAKPIVGITESDWVKTYNAIQCEYNEAHARQAKPEAEPNQYMRGLAKALKILDAIRPYNISEVQQ